MNRLKAVDLLIERYNQRAVRLTQLAQESIDKVKELQAYRYDLTRPGFKIKGWARYTGKPARIEPYVVAAGNTHGAE